MNTPAAPGPTPDHAAVFTLRAAGTAAVILALGLVLRFHPVTSGAAEPATTEATTAKPPAAEAKTTPPRKTARLKGEATTTGTMRISA